MRRRWGGGGRGGACRRRWGGGGAGGGNRRRWGRGRGGGRGRRGRGGGGRGGGGGLGVGLTGVATAMTQPRGGMCSCWPTATMIAALATCWLFHWPTFGQPPAGGGGGLAGVALVRLGAGLAQPARAMPPAPMTAAPTQHVMMT